MICTICVTEKWLYQSPTVTSPKNSAITRSQSLIARGDSAFGRVGPNSLWPHSVTNASLWALLRLFASLMYQNRTNPSSEGPHTAKHKPDEF